jgi:hypothetical protein
MDNEVLILVLALATFALVAVVAIWQRGRVAKLKKDPERSAFVDNHGTAPRPNRPGTEH